MNDEMIMSVIDDGYLKRFMYKNLREWMDEEEFLSDLYLATVRASKNYDPSKGKWRTFVYWYWRSVLSEIRRSYRVRSKVKKYSACELKLESIVDNRCSFIQENSAIESALDELHCDDKAVLFGTHRELGKTLGMAKQDFDRKKRFVARKVFLRIEQQ